MCYFSWSLLYFIMENTVSSTKCKYSVRWLNQHHPASPVSLLSNWIHLRSRCGLSFHKEWCNTATVWACHLLDQPQQRLTEELLYDPSCPVQPLGRRVTLKSPYSPHQICPHPPLISCPQPKEFLKVCWGEGAGRVNAVSRPHLLSWSQPRRAKSELKLHWDL